MSESERVVTEKKESLWGSLKGLVLEEVPDTAPAATPAPAPVAAPPPPSHASGGPAMVPRLQTVDPAVRKLLERDVNEAAKPAYSEFVKLQDSLAPVLPDESTRFKAVLAALTPNGHSVDQVLVDIDECFQALDKKEADAAAAAAKMREQRVGSRQTEVEKLTAQIEDLKAQIAKHEVARERLQAEIHSEVADLEQREAEFAAAIHAYRSELTERKNKILRLKGA